MRRFEPSIEARITNALGKLLTAIEAGDADVTAGGRSALIRHGENLSKASGTAALRAALDVVCAAKPERAAERRTMITAAWSGLEEWGE